jgi:hypothetical protein
MTWLRKVQWMGTASVAVVVFALFLLPDIGSDWIEGFLGSLF